MSTHLAIKRLTTGRPFLLYLIAALISLYIQNIIFKRQILPRDYNRRNQILIYALHNVINSELVILY